MIEILSTQQFYTLVGDYMNRLDPTWESDGWLAQLEEEKQRFLEILGEAGGRSILDCSCGSGRQAFPLASLGWQVTASDITEASLHLARQRALAENVPIGFLACDIRDLLNHFQASFDWAITCMALDNLVEAESIRQALVSIAAVIKPGGGLYIRQRNFDQIMEDRPRYEFKEERIVPFGRVIRIEDWDYQSEAEVVNLYVFIREDSRHPEYWDTEVFAYRRCALRHAVLMDLLQSAGFERIEFRPGPTRWHYYEMIARKPAG